MSQPTYKGGCFCGAVELSVVGEPAAMGFCHCGDCRAWAAAPVNAFTLWKKENVTVTKGGELIGTFNKTERSGRQFCTHCGGHIMSEHPAIGMIDVYAAILPDLPFAPRVHVHYAERVIDMDDGVPKFDKGPEGAIG